MGGTIGNSPTDSQHNPVWVEKPDICTTRLRKSGTGNAGAQEQKKRRGSAWRRNKSASARKVLVTSVSSRHGTRDSKLEVQGSIKARGLRLKAHSCQNSSTAVFSRHSPADAHSANSARSDRQSALQHPQQRSSRTELSEPGPH